MRNFTLHDTSDSGYTIGKLRFSFAINNNDSLFAFYDEIKRRFVIAHPDGNIENIIGNKGRGPGEIVRSGGFNFNSEDQLVVNDISQRILKIFDVQSGLEHNSKIQNTSYPFVGLTFHIFNNKIFTATIDREILGNIRNKAWESRLVSVYNYQGNLIDTLGRYDPRVKNAKDYNKFPSINIDRNRKYLLSVHRGNYSIQIYDLKTERRIAWFGHKTAHYNKGNEYISKHLSKRKIMDKSVGRSATIDVYTTKKYILLYFEILTKAFFDTKDFNKKKPYLVVYNSQTHACYGELKLPYILGNVANNKLYLIEDTNPDHFTVGVYEIQQGA